MEIKTDVLNVVDLGELEISSTDLLNALIPVMRNKKHTAFLRKLLRRDDEFLSNKAKGGSWIKRYKRAYYKENGINPPKGLLDRMGERVGKLFASGGNYYFVFTKKKWRAGSFKDNEYSCWFSGGPDSNVNRFLATDYGYGVKFFESEASFKILGGKRGIGRCWMSTKSGPVIFNGYGIELIRMAQVLGKFFKKKYAKVRMSSENLYMNGDGYKFYVSSKPSSASVSAPYRYRMWMGLGGDY